MSENENNPSKMVTMTGAVVGLCIVGDSLLYNILPLEVEKLGISAILLGTLLSANRFVRLASNTWVSRLYERYSPKALLTAAVILALITTASYGFAEGFVCFLLARIGWGIAWSGLRHAGFQAIWSGAESRRGRLMGLFWGTVRVGSAASVLLGGLLYDRFGFRTAVLAIAGLTTMAIPLSQKIRLVQKSPVAKEKNSPTRSWLGAIKDAQHRLLLAAGFFHSGLEGVIASTLSLYLVGRAIALPVVGVATLTGALLALRWISDLVFGPGIGALADRVGRPRMARILGFVTLAGLAGAVLNKSPWALSLLALVFIAGAGQFVTLTAMANSRALRTAAPHRFVGLYTTAIDAGLAAGPIFAFSVGEAVGFPTLYLILAGVLTITLLFIQKERTISEN